MKELGLEILNKIYEYGYIGYIIGGYTRDYLLGNDTTDIDITTNATPMEIKNIFPDVYMMHESYGSVRINYKNVRFDITTFRKEEDYIDHRHPNSITYVNDLKTDLLRRDFTINTICMDKDGNIIDILNAKEDLNNHILKTIIDADTSFKIDALRILRAIRFAAILSFKLSTDIEKAIINNKSLLKEISFNRKKEELDKIFGSTHAKEGIKLLKKFNLDQELDLTSIDRVKDYSDIVGIWAMINPNKYQFTSSEKDLINKINVVYTMNNLDNYVLYKYGLYVNLLAGINKEIKKKDILKKYDELQIKSRDEIDISVKEMCDLLKKKPGSFIGKIYDELEKLILSGIIQNKKENICHFIKEKQKGNEIK